MQLDDNIVVAGAGGMVGSAIVRQLQALGYSNITALTRQQADLCDQAAVERWFEQNRCDYLFIAAAKVGGILANSSKPAEFIYQNLMMQCNLIHAAWKHSVKKLLFLGSSCIYPKFATQPIDESQLLAGALEPTNSAYAVAKIAGIEMCQAYQRQYGLRAISLMPTNLYGPGDNYDLQNSHVLPALIAKFHHAKQAKLPEVSCWGDGSALREFLHVDDLAAACVTCMLQYEDPSIINIGSGEELSIGELADLVSLVVGYEGEIVWDTSKPNGTPRKVLDITKIRSLGWEPRIGLVEGIKKTYADYLQTLAASGC